MVRSGEVGGRSWSWSRAGRPASGAAGHRPPEGRRGAAGRRARPQPPCPEPPPTPTSRIPRAWTRPGPAPWGFASRSRIARFRPPPARPARTFSPPTAAGGTPARVRRRGRRSGAPCWTRAVRLICTVYCHKESPSFISVACSHDDPASDRKPWIVRNLSQKSPSSAQDLCEPHPIENAQAEFVEIGRANVSSSARSLMTVGRTNQTHGPGTYSAPPLPSMSACPCTQPPSAACCWQA